MAGASSFMDALFRRGGSGGFPIGFPRGGGGFSAGGGGFLGRRRRVWAAGGASGAGENDERFRSKNFWRKAELRQIETYIRRRSARPWGEIVVMVGARPATATPWPACSDLQRFLSAAVALTRTGRPLVWGPRPHDLWVFLGILFLCFSSSGNCHAASPAEAFFRFRKGDGPRSQGGRHDLFFFERLASDAGGDRHTDLPIVFRESLGDGDRGVMPRCPPGFWRRSWTRSCRNQEDRGGCHLRAVGRIRGVLAEKFPAAPGDTNELQNLIVEAIVTLGEPFEDTGRTAQQMGGGIAFILVCRCI